MDKEVNEFFIDEQDEYGRAQLHHAISRHDIELVRTLINRGEIEMNKEFIDGEVKALEEKIYRIGDDPINRSNLMTRLEFWYDQRKKYTE